MSDSYIKEKYKKVIAAIAAANNTDMSVGYAMLLSSVKHHYGVTYVNGSGERVLFDEYAGIPDSFDYAEFLADSLK